MSNYVGGRFMKHGVKIILLLLVLLLFFLFAYLPIHAYGTPTTVSGRLQATEASIHC